MQYEIQSGQEFGLVSACPFPMMVTITIKPPIYIYIYIYIYRHDLSCLVISMNFTEANIISLEDYYKSRTNKHENYHIRPSQKVSRLKLSTFLI